MTCLILDAHLHSALSTVRSLGKKNSKIFSASDTRLAPSFFSRYSVKNFLYPSPLKDESAFIKKITSILESFKDDCLVYIFSETTLLPLSRNRNKLPKNTRLILGSLENVELASDKAATLTLAAENNIPIPQTFFPGSFAEAQNFLSKIPYPCIVKPRHNCVWKDGASVYETAHLVETKEEAEKIWRELFNASGEPPLIQERVVGEERGIFTFAIKGEGFAWFAHKRLESLKKLGGASILRESIEVDPKLKSYSELLIKKLDWTGPLMIEWKWDENAKRYLLMEINARFWGSLPLAVASGVDYPALMLDFAVGQSLPNEVTYKISIRSRHFFGALRSLLRAKTWRDFQKLWQIMWGKKTIDDVFSFSDPLPFLGEVLFIGKTFIWKK